MKKRSRVRVQILVLKAEFVETLLLHKSRDGWWWWWLKWRRSCLMALLFLFFVCEWMETHLVNRGQHTENPTWWGWFNMDCLLLINGVHQPIISYRLTWNLPVQFLWVRRYIIVCLDNNDVRRNRYLWLKAKSRLKYRGFGPFKPVIRLRTKTGTSMVL